jgi:hypothetical protein
MPSRRYHRRVRLSRTRRVPRVALPPGSARNTVGHLPPFRLLAGYQSQAYLGRRLARRAGMREVAAAMVSGMAVPDTLVVNPSEAIDALFQVARRRGTVVRAALSEEGSEELTRALRHSLRSRSISSLSTDYWLQVARSLQPLGASLSEDVPANLDLAHQAAALLLMAAQAAPAGGRGALPGLFGYPHRDVTVPLGPLVDLLLSLGAPGVESVVPGVDYRHAPSVRSNYFFFLRFCLFSLRPWASKNN